jgi:hypothetical protein
VIYLTGPAVFSLTFSFFRFFLGGWVGLDLMDGVGPLCLGGHEN